MTDEDEGEGGVAAGCVAVGAVDGPGDTAVVEVTAGDDASGVVTASALGDDEQAATRSETTVITAIIKRDERISLPSRGGAQP